MKSKILTSEQMMQVDKESKRQMAKIEKNKVTIKRNTLPRVEDYEENLSSSSISMYILDSREECLEFLSIWNPTIVIHGTPLSLHEEEICISSFTKKFPSERHLVVLEDDHPSSYNIEEILGSFTFNFHRREVSQKRVRKVKQVDGTLEEMQEDEVLFERTDKDPMMVATTSSTLTQAIVHNILVLSEKVMEAKSKNQNLKDEIINLREEMKKRRKVYDHLVPLKKNILEQQEQLHDVKVQCFMDIQNMADNIKAFEKHLEIAS